MKVLFTDYDVLLTYICQEMLPNGRCSMEGSHIRLWSRNESMDQDTRDYAMDFAAWACVDESSHTMLDTIHDGKNNEHRRKNTYHTKICPCNILRFLNGCNK